MKKLMHFLRDEDGVVNIEYGLIAGFVAIAVVLALGLIGDNLNTLYGQVNTQLGAAATP
jgi:pilus assembly protein Flp/PilA